MTRRGFRYALLSGCLCGALLAGCAGGPTSAPVVDRSPAPARQAKPPVAQAAPVPGAATPVEGPAGYYRVKRGDTLYSIALDHGVDHRDVARWNHLDNPAHIRTGQLLLVTPPAGEPPVQVGAARGAGAVASRPIEARPLDAQPAPQAAPLTAPLTGEGVVKTEPKALRLPYSGENLAMLQKSGEQPVVAPGGTPAGSQAAVQPAPPVASQPAAQPAAQPAPSAVPAAAKPAAAESADGIEFIWPVKGKLLAGFAEPASKGLDIGGKPGDPVVAAAPGRVIYIGNGIRGYGKLIVIKHDNNFNSVYAHNREIFVKQDQSVARGQKIAELGDTDSDKPMLHFEIRKSGKPVDPAKYLPPAPSS